MHCRWSICICAALSCAAILRADTIVLKSGEHREGQIVGETADEVSIRTRFKGGNITFVDKIKRSDIARIDKGEATTEPAEIPETQPAAEPVLSTQRIADKPAFLDAAIKKYQKPDYAAAGMDLSRLITASSPPELQRFSQTVQQETHVSLGGLAASAHFEAAMQRSAGRAVQFQYVTEYEKPFLIPLIEEEYQKTITDPVIVPHDDEGDDAHEANDRPHRAHAADDAKAGAEPAAGEAQEAPAPGRRAPGREPAARGQQRGRRMIKARTDDGEDKDSPAEEKSKDGAEERDDKKPASRPALTVESWMHRSKEFDGTRAEAQAMIIKIARAQSLLSERIRLDPRAKTDLAVRDEIAKDRSALTVLLKSVRSRAGGALTAKEKEARDLKARNEADAARRADQRRQNEILDGLQKIIGEQQQQREGAANGVDPNGVNRREQPNRNSR